MGSANHEESSSRWEIIEGRFFFPGLGVVLTKIFELALEERSTALVTERMVYPSTEEETRKYFLGGGVY